ncbi:energy transducer TonB [Pyxidicoccus parkwayensis]|uniref:energy transducer TonB n=1 Tax=Pyxidicoccus parkwayensis TaxID=2813578 RepID=UPI001F50446B|nr:energy transducer TonB [Pyxidicoccus parkwaysis]
MQRFPEVAADFVPAAGELEEPKLVVEHAQARGVYDEALAVLRGKPTPEGTSAAQDDLRAACRAGLQEACDFMRKEFSPPVKISGAQPQYPSEALQKGTQAVVVVRCQLGATGLFRDCQVLESGPDGLTESVLAYAARANYHPARFAGHPFSIPYTFTINFNPYRVDLSPQQEIELTKARTERFPRSPPAWARLANLLSRHAPEDPALAESLRVLHALVPSYWWPANELAWLHVQAGRHAEAAPLVTRAMTWEPDNSYVLETSAAVLAATGQCEQALVEQRRAVEKLPAEWPAPERERFTRTLAEYQRQCAGAAAATEPR